jgi:hypothetical protein
MCPGSWLSYAHWRKNANMREAQTENSNYREEKLENKF